LVLEEGMPLGADPSVATDAAAELVDETALASTAVRDPLLLDLHEPGEPDFLVDEEF